MGYKRKKRKSRLLFGEGLEDKALFKHLLRVLKVDAQDVYYIQPGCGTGGSANDIIDAAAREIGNFDKRLVILDRDDKTDEELQGILSYAQNKGVECYFVTPSLESIILNVLNPGSDWKKCSSRDCKHEVESKHISRKKRTDHHAYKKLTAQKIAESIKSDPELMFIVEYITKG